MVAGAGQQWADPPRWWTDGELAERRATCTGLRRRLRSRVGSDATSVPAPQIDPDERAVDLAWAAGLFAGEGYCAAIRRGGHLTVYLGVSMLDARSIERFATIFGRRRVSFPYHRDRSREVHRVVATGRPAEEILSLMWPHLVGTDKADQVRRACEEVGTFAWVDGTATTRRPTRLGGNQWAGRRHSDATIQKMSEARRKWWADKRAREADDG